MQVISPRHVEHIEEYALNFDSLDIPGAGFSFRCDAAGVPVQTENNRDNLARCLAGEGVGPAYVRDLSRDYVADEVRRCGCGGEATLSRYCGAFICHHCGEHDGLARCFCGWSASGRDGRRELIEYGENLDDDA